MRSAFFAALVSVGLVAPSASADGPPPELDPAERVVHFVKPAFWGDVRDETWTLRDRNGAERCVLPCTTIVGPRSGYVLDGLGTTPDLPDRVERLRVPGLPGGAPSTAFVARAYPATGSEGVAVFLGLVGAAALVGGSALIVVGGESRDNVSGGIDVLTGVLLDLVGAACSIGGITVGTFVHPARLAIAPMASAPRRPPALRLSLGPSGLSGTF